MKVCLRPSDKRACALFRCEEPARVARDEGVDAEISRSSYDIYQAPFGKVVCSAQEHEGEQRVVEWQEDVVVFQRPIAEHIVEAIPALQSRQIAVVIDLDDDLTALPPQHPSYGYFRERVHSTLAACRLADLVTCTTQAIADRFAAHGRYVILPNCVPQSMLEMGRVSDGETLGWSGFQGMHPGDLEVCRGGVKEALDRSGWHFRVIGPREEVAGILNLSHIEETGRIESINDFWLAVGTLDVGIVPLAATAFNESKSYLKGLEYAARGVPFVYSPTTPYRELDLGFPSSPRGRNWCSNLLRLIEDESLRDELRDLGREKVEADHTYETQGWRWPEAWEKAMDNRQEASERELAAA